MSYYTELVLFAGVRKDKVKEFKQARDWPENYEAVGLRILPPLAHRHRLRHDLRGMKTKSSDSCLHLEMDLVYISGVVYPQ